MGLYKDKLIYDATSGQGDEMTAHLFASNLLTSQAINGLESLNTFAAMADGAGTALTSTLVSGKQALDINIASPLSITTDLDGFYDVSTNPTPDTVGSIIRTRAATPGLSDQIQPITGAAGSSDAVVAANVHGMDVNAFGMIFNGTTWDRVKGTSGSMNVSPLGNIADDGVDSGNPVKVGSRAVSGALTAVSTTGDRADLLSDLYRRIWVNDAPNVAGSNAAVSVDTTSGGVALFASPLPGRTWAQIQNLGSKDIFIGFGTVSAVNGSRIAAGATETVKLGPDLALKAIATSGTQDVRVLQLA